MDEQSTDAHISKTMIVLGEQVGASLQKEPFQFYIYTTVAKPLFFLQWRGPPNSLQNLSYIQIELLWFILRDATLEDCFKAPAPAENNYPWFYIPGLGKQITLVFRDLHPFTGDTQAVCIVLERLTKSCLDLRLPRGCFSWKLVGTLPKAIF